MIEDVEYPYSEKKYLDKYEEMEQKIKNSGEILDCWKVRLKGTAGESQKKNSIEQQ